MATVSSRCETIAVDPLSAGAADLTAHVDFTAFAAAATAAGAAAHGPVSQGDF